MGSDNGCNEKYTEKSVPLHYEIKPVGIPPVPHTVTNILCHDIIYIQEHLYSLLNIRVLICALSITHSLLSYISVE